MTRHLEVEEAVDIATGVASATLRARITRHLATGCARCQETLDWAGQVARTARESLEIDVPDAVVRQAVAAFATHRPAARPSFARRLLATLVFDSAMEPALAGVRSGKGTTRQMMYRAGEFLVDLRVDFDRGQRLASLVGQVAAQGIDTRSPGVSFGSAQLTSRNTVVAESGINEFGEFQFECRPESRLRLKIPLMAGPEAGTIEVPLAALMEPGSKPAKSPRG